MKRAIVSGILALVWTSVMPVFAEAQTTYRYNPPSGTSISGKVTDKSGTGLSGATVIAKNRDTGFVATVTADDTGAFRFSNLPEGYYSISALASGLAEPRIG